MKVGNWTISLVVSNNCFKYAPKWMVSSLIFQKFSGEGSPSPLPRPLPPIFLGLRPRFGLRPQFSGASRPRLGLRPRYSGASRPRLGLRPRYSGASRPRFGLRPQLSIGDLGLAPPKINSWIRPCSIRWIFAVEVEKAAVIIPIPASPFHGAVIIINQIEIISVVIAIIRREHHPILYPLDVSIGAIHDVTVSSLDVTGHVDGIVCRFIVQIEVVVFGSHPLTIVRSL